MNKEQLAEELARMRGDRKIDTLSSYAVRSIETGGSSYPVSNLLKYCEALSVQMVMSDMVVDEHYPVDTMQEVHEVLQMLMERWDTDCAGIFRKAGVHYTPPKGNTGSLSIVTMLAMCSVLHCKLDFIK